MVYDDLPIASQTMFADLVEKAWTGNIAGLTARGGSPYTREVKGRLYWYWRPATQYGSRPSPLYLGPDREQTQTRINTLSDQAASLKQRRDMVRALRAARLPVPDTMTGNVLAAMAEAGVFRLRAVVVGAVAFQSYAGILGTHLPASLSRTCSGAQS